MKKNILLKLFSILIICLLFCSCSNEENKNNNSNINVENNEETHKEIKMGDSEYLNSIKTCKTKDCIYNENINYYYLSYDTGVSEIDEIIEKINAETKNKYDKTKSSNFDSEFCKDKVDTLNISHMYNSNYIVYSNNDFITIGVIHESHDLCKNEYESLQATAYIYDRNDKKIITQEEFKKKLGIHEEQIYEAIEFSVNDMNKINNKYKLKDNYDDVILFYASNGDLFASYQIDENSPYILANIIL